MVTEIALVPQSEEQKDFWNGKDQRMNYTIKVADTYHIVKLEDSVIKYALVNDGILFLVNDSDAAVFACQVNDFQFLAWGKEVEPNDVLEGK